MTDVSGPMIIVTPSNPKHLYIYHCTMTDVSGPIIIVTPSNPKQLYIYHCTMTDVSGPIIIVTPSNPKQLYIYHCTMTDVSGPIIILRRHSRRELLKSLVTMSRVTHLIPKNHTGNRVSQNQRNQKGGREFGRKEKKLKLDQEGTAIRKRRKFLAVGEACVAIF